jgi:hypothetical protein
MDEKTLKEKLIGSVKRITNKGNFSVDVKELLRPFKEKEIVVRSFCQGCGVVLDVNREGAEDLAKLAGVTLPSSLEGYYFQTKTCVLCQGNDFMVELKRIPK